MGIMAELWFGGVSSADAGIRHVEKYPDLNRPARKSEVASVPARNGDLVRLYDAWENYEQEYEIYAGTGAKGSAPQAFRTISEWLNPVSEYPHDMNLAVGYSRLEDIYEPDYFRLAYFAGPLDVENIFSQYGRATITFNCRPERFLKSGEQEITVDPSLPTSGTTGTRIMNPTGFWSKPLLKLTGSGTFKVVWSTGASMTGSTTTVTILDLGSSSKTLYIDMETEQAWFSSGESANDYLGMTEPIFLRPGNNYIRALQNGNSSGTLTSFKVIPRWWTL